ncbi:nucleotidyltransferase domain-containing protein [Thermococcus sp.]
MMALIACIRQNLGHVPCLYSLILYGSLARGDFLPGTSDVDFFIVLEDGTEPEEVLSEIRPVLKECSQGRKAVEVDLFLLQALPFRAGYNQPSNWPLSGKAILF